MAGLTSASALPALLLILESQPSSKIVVLWFFICCVCVHLCDSQLANVCPLVDEVVVLDNGRVVQQVGIQSSSPVGVSAGFLVSPCTNRGLLEVHFPLYFTLTHSTFASAFAGHPRGAQ